MHRTHSHRKRWRRTLLYLLLILILCTLIHGVLRGSAAVRCTPSGDKAYALYSREESIEKAVALNILTYGCETEEDLSGTATDLIDTHEMGILTQNAGILREDPADPSTALFDSAEYVKNQVGDFRFLTDRRAKNSFYGAAFCDDAAGCVWISYAGSVTARDALACAEFVLIPGLSGQEKEAFALYEEVLLLPEVKNDSYAVLLTGHSLGGSLASMVSMASGAPAVTVNGACGIAVSKMQGIERNAPDTGRITNHLTDPANGKVAAMDLVQRLMFLGADQDVNAFLYPANDLTTDTHCAYSFLEWSGDLRSPVPPQESKAIEK